MQPTHKLFSFLFRERVYMVFVPSWIRSTTRSNHTLLSDNKHALTNQATTPRLKLLNVFSLIMSKKVGLSFPLWIINHLAKNCEGVKIIQLNTSFTNKKSLIYSSFFYFIVQNMSTKVPIKDLDIDYWISMNILTAQLYLRIFIWSLSMCGMEILKYHNYIQYYQI